MYDFRIKTSNEVIEGTTCEFLEVVCQAALYIGVALTSDWVEALLTDQSAQLDFLRLTDWKFDWHPSDSVSIRIKKYGY